MLQDDINTEYLQPLIRYFLILFRYVLCCVKSILSNQKFSNLEECILQETQLITNIDKILFVLYLFCCSLIIINSITKWFYNIIKIFLVNFEIVIFFIILIFCILIFFFYCRIFFSYNTARGVVLWLLNTKRFFKLCYEAILFVTRSMIVQDKPTKIYRYFGRYVRIAG